jgi:DNA-binding transcriptional ArsR family regulator
MVYSGWRASGRPLHRTVWKLPGADRIPPRKPGNRAADRGYERACLILAALGHPQRIRILEAMFGRTATYRELQEICRLQPGPFYHHIGELRLAGLIATKRRDTYEVTTAGKEAFGLVMMARQRADRS